MGMPGTPPRPSPAPGTPLQVPATPVASQTCARRADEHKPPLNQRSHQEELADFERQAGLEKDLLSIMREASLETQLYVMSNWQEAAAVRSCPKKRFLALIDNRRKLVLAQEPTQSRFKKLVAASVTQAKSQEGQHCPQCLLCCKMYKSDAMFQQHFWRFHWDKVKSACL